MPGVLTTPFVAMCATSFFCFAQNYVTLPLLPLMVLSIGGDAALVGLVVAAFSISSFVLRPFVGQLVDRWSLKGVLAIGTLILGVTGFGYAIPSVVALFLNRTVHGLGWAMVNTAGNATIAMLAPPARRGEAGGYYAMMPGLAQTVAPAIALAILPIAGFSGAFAVAGVCGFIAMISIGLIKIPQPPRRAVPAGAFWGQLLDRAAFLPMIIETLSSSAFTLFAVFVPLYAVTINVPIESLGIYFSVIGTTVVIGRAAFGRLSDRLGRGLVIAIGGVAALVGIVLLWLARDLGFLIAGGVGYGIGAALVSPTTFALAADRTDPSRRGATFATYSMSFQLANGFGGLVWGTLIALAGFPAAFAAAIAVQMSVLAAGLALRARGN